MSLTVPRDIKDYINLSANLVKHRPWQQGGCPLFSTHQRLLVRIFSLE